MSKMITVVLSAALLTVACGSNSDRPTSPMASARFEKGGTSANQGIDDIQDALNAAWAAKDAAAYAAPFADDANIISPVGTVLAGRPAIEARHVILLGGPLSHSTQIVT